MPGIEIKGRSKRANYRHGGRAGFAMGSTVRKAGEAIKRLKKQGPKNEDDKSLPQRKLTPMAPRLKKKKGGKAFPDHSGDGKITQKDILMAKGVIPKTKGKK